MCWMPPPGFRVFTHQNCKRKNDATTNNHQRDVFQICLVPKWWYGWGWLYKLSNAMLREPCTFCLFYTYLCSLHTWLCFLMAVHSATGWPSMAFHGYQYWIWWWLTGLEASIWFEASGNWLNLWNTATQHVTQLCETRLRRTSNSIQELNMTSSILQILTYPLL